MVLLSREIINFIVTITAIVKNCEVIIVEIRAPCALDQNLPRHLETYVEWCQFRARSYRLPILQFVRDICESRWLGLN